MPSFVKSNQRQDASTTSDREFLMLFFYRESEYGQYFKTDQDDGYSYYLQKSRGKDKNGNDMYVLSRKPTPKDITNGK